MDVGAEACAAVVANLQAVQAKVATVTAIGRGAPQLIAVSKTKPSALLQAASPHNSSDTILPPHLITERARPLRSRL